MIRFSL